MGSANIIRDIHLSRQKDIQTNREDEARTTALRDLYTFLGTSELGMSTGKLLPSQEAELSGLKETGRSEAAKFGKESGLSGREQEINDQFMMDSLIMKESMQEAHFAKAIQALGFSLEETQSLIKEHAADRQQNIEIYQGLMGAIGGIIGMFSKSGG